MSFFFYYYYSFLLVIALTNDPFCFLTAYSESFPLLAVYVPRCFLLYTHCHGSMKHKSLHWS